MKYLLLAALLWPVLGIAQEKPAPTVQVMTATPQQGSRPRTVTAYGVLQAAPGSSETLSLLRAGRVTRVLVAAGQRVQQGQTLLVVAADPAALTAYRQATAALALARGGRARTAQMLSQQLATRDQLAIADKAVSDAQTTLELLNRGGGGNAEQTLAAPFDGAVSALAVAPGARVAAQAPLVTIDRSSRLVAAIGIEPAQLSLVAPEQPTQLTPLEGGDAVSGRVLSIGAMLDPVLRLVPVLIDAPQTGPALLPGGGVQAVLEVGAFRGWLLPRDAVGTDAQGTHVFQIQDQKAVRVAVQVVGVVGDTTVATGPLDPKRPLVTAGQAQLQDGAAVRQDAAASPNGVAAK